MTFYTSGYHLVFWKQPFISHLVLWACSFACGWYALCPLKNLLAILSICQSSLSFCWWNLTLCIFSSILHRAACHVPSKVFNSFLFIWLQTDTHYLVLITENGSVDSHGQVSMSFKMLSLWYPDAPLPQSLPNKPQKMCPLLHADLNTGHCLQLQSPGRPSARRVPQWLQFTPLGGNGREISLDSWHVESHNFDVFKVDNNLKTKLRHFKIF